MLVNSKESSHAVATELVESVVPHGLIFLLLVWLGVFFPIRRNAKPRRALKIQAANPLKQPPARTPPILGIKGPQSP